MTLRNNSVTEIFACIACASVLLTGCATVNQEPGLAESPSSAPETRVTTSKPKTRSITATTPTGLLVDTPLTVVEAPVPQQAPPAIDLTCDAKDVFQRMRNGFAMPDINSELVLAQQRMYLSRPEYLRRMVERSGLYMHHIVEELDKRGMPMELALLPMVESAYNPMAFSRAKASGLWQFIPATGRRYKLDQDSWKDERRDIVASTAAALDYLQSIYEMHGDWHLALASYNWGEGAVARAINKNRSKGLPTDYLSLSMPRETRNYVPKLQALKNIFSDPNVVASLGLPQIPNQPYFDTISNPRNIDVKIAAKLAEMPVHEFVALNPSHNRPVIKSATPMILPADKVETFENNLEAHQESNKPLSVWQTYTMKLGDKLDAIARRFGMTLANLKAINGIKGKIKATPGVSLLVAGKDGGEVPNTAANLEPSRKPESAPENTTSSRTHTVRKGDTLPLIAKRYGTSVAELKRINHLGSDKISAGTRLAVAAAGKDTAKESSRAKDAAREPHQTTKQQPKESTRMTHYTVRPGDTLDSIARQFRVDAEDLERWNKVSPKKLKPGRTLIIQLARNP